MEFLNLDPCDFDHVSEISKHKDSENIFKKIRGDGNRVDTGRLLGECGTSHFKIALHQNQLRWVTKYDMIQLSPRHPNVLRVRGWNNTLQKVDGSDLICHAPGSYMFWSLNPDTAVIPE